MFEGVFSSPVQLLQRASDQLESAKSALTSKRQNGQQVRPTPPKTWKPPPSNFLKCNWDAAIDTGGKRMGVGLVVRNHEGEVIAAKCFTKPFVTDPMTAEAVGAWSAAQFVRQLGMDQIILEGDSLGVVQSLQGEGNSWAMAGQMLDDVKITLGSCRAWQVRHVRREANSAADRLAKHALSLNGEHQWRLSIPICIHEIVLAEKLLPR